jgi:hypothetical protein
MEKDRYTGNNSTGKPEVRGRRGPGRQPRRKVVPGTQSVKKEGGKRRQVACFELPTGSLLDSLGLPVS